MAGRMNSCLNLPPLTNRNTPLKKTSNLPCASKQRRREEEEEEKENRSNPRRSKSYILLQVAAAIVSFQMIDVESVESVVLNFESPVKEVLNHRRWSDKRMCPSWLHNSFEIIVPENLPRPPSAHRRSELAGLFMTHAPPLGAVVTRADRTACFSM